MVPVTALWAPILLSAVIVFVASSIIHMVLGYHFSDYRQAPAENRILEAIGGAGLDAGNYMMPHPGTRAGMKDPAFVEKRTRGPVAFVTVMGSLSMGKSLALWFVYCAVVGVFAAYVAGRALGPGAEYLEVFRFAGTTAFVGYALALWQNSIWYRIAWSTTLKSTFDGLVYGLLTAGAFGWLWPA